MTRVAFDIDGVLADFHAAYRATLIDVSGRDLIPAREQPPCWDYAQTYGYTAEEDTRAWERINRSPTFWVNLNPLPAAKGFLRQIQRWLDACGEREVYFVTSRTGVALKRQTEQWLHDHGIQYPSVVVTSATNKAAVCHALGCHWLVEDSSANLFTLYEHPQPRITKGALLRARYNEADIPALRAQGAVILDKLNDFWRHI